MTVVEVEEAIKKIEHCIHDIKDPAKKMDMYSWLATVYITRKEFEKANDQTKISILSVINHFYNLKHDQKANLFKKFEDLSDYHIENLKDYGVSKNFLLRIAEKFLDLGIC